MKTQIICMKIAALTNALDALTRARGGGQSSDADVKIEAEIKESLRRECAGLNSAVD